MQLQIKSICFGLFLIVGVLDLIMASKQMNNFLSSFSHPSIQIRIFISQSYISAHRELLSSQNPAQYTKLHFNYLIKWLQYTIITGCQCEEGTESINQIIYLTHHLVIIALEIGINFMCFTQKLVLVRILCSLRELNFIIVCLALFMFYRT